jgi:thiol-disulfide isomerase/thioredoxin
MLAGLVAAAMLPAALPDLTFTLQNGQQLRLEGCRGRPVAVQIWATWCGPCREELRQLQKVQVEWGSRACVLALAVDAQGWRSVTPLLREHNLTLPVAIVTPAALRRFGVRVPVDPLPQSLFYDRGGRLIAWKREAMSAEALREEMERAGVGR